MIFLALLAMAPDVEKAIYEAYGALQVTRGVRPPLVFADQAAIDAFTADLAVATVQLGDHTFALQAPAARALAAARDALATEGIVLRARPGHPAGRSWQASVEAWRSRVEPGLAHWVDAGRLAADDAARIRGLEPVEQVAAVLELEAQGMWCNTWHNRTILTSVAAPGTSQHHSLLAIDLDPYTHPRVGPVLAAHGWYRTVYADRPHFAWLGRSEPELRDAGLTEVQWQGLAFWIPKATATPLRVR